MSTPSRLSAHPAARSHPGGRPPGAAGNLPTPLDRFVGRERELALVAAALEHGRLVSITGAPGVGKSRLAQQAAAGVQHRFSGGVWLVDVSRTTAVSRLRAQLDALLPPEPEDDAPDCDAAPPHEALLLLDGCERLDAECTAHLVRLLEHTRGLRALTTGRRALDAPGERRCVLAPLPEESAVDLLAERAADVLATVDSAAVLATANSADGAPTRERLAALCRRLDGLPLAVELAAHRLRALSVEQLRDRLAAPFDILEASTRSGPEHHRSLRTAIGLSHQLCTPTERLLWARLSVFAGEFDLEAAEYLCADDDLPRTEVLDALDRLVAQSVVVRSRDLGADGQARYRLLGTLQTYGAEWLERLGEGELRRRRHRDWYVGVAAWSELDWFGPRQEETVARLEADLPDLRAALEFSAADAEGADVAQYLAGSLWFLWLACGRQHEGEHWLDRALTHSATRAGVQARALCVRALLFLCRGETGENGAAAECIARAHTLAESTDDEALATLALRTHGCQLLAHGDADGARAAFETALERFRGHGEFDTWVILTQIELAHVHTIHGDLRTAHELAQEAAEVAADSHDRWSWAYAQHALAHVHLHRGDTLGSLRAALDAAAVRHRFGDLPGMVQAAELLATLLEPTEPERAAELLGAADAGWRALGARHFGATAYGGPSRTCRSHLLTALGHPRFEAALRTGERLGVVDAVAREIARDTCPPDAPAPSAPHSEEPVVTPPLGAV